MIIVNADDFGQSRETNEAIAQAFREKLIGSATIIANAPAFHDACDLIRSGGLGDRIGIHLNISEHEPLTPEMRAWPVFCGPDGRLRFEREARLWLSRGERRALSRELDAQIERCRRAGLRLTHADSHHHSHTEPGVFLALAPVLRKRGIRLIRLSDNVRPARWPRAAYKFIFNRGIRCFGLKGTDYFTDFSNLKPLRDIIARDSAAIELMVHPGYGADGALVDLGTKRPLAGLIAELPKAVRLGSYASL